VARDTRLAATETAKDFALARMTEKYGEKYGGLAQHAFALYFRPDISVIKRNRDSGNVSLQDRPSRSDRDSVSASFVDFAVSVPVQPPFPVISTYFPFNSYSFF
jgi:hypothetical protein